MSKSSVTAVLGPTNTGKTYLAVERLCAHSSGMIGFPLRLLAREVYDRVRRLKGDREVALLTGEERIAPPGARWLICTTESMPIERDVSFVAVDEAQLGADRERGHVFTDRLLNARGREETMILGSDTIRPLVRSLVPEAEIIGRPRFSQLTFAGSKKISRLPPRSAIVAFSADDVYAIAELLRRTRGGAAVVMGALSPRTRNAQVEMFQSGEVDFLVATDAIGMGLNMDVGHIAFASLSKFDGKKLRRLTVSEMAQIAGRAGRHQRDGTFGTVLTGDGSTGFAENEIERIEEHRFQPLDHLYWRNAELQFHTIDALIESLEMHPLTPELRAAPEAVDLAVLKSLATNPDTVAEAQGIEKVSRLWEVCGLPDFRQSGVQFHSRLVAQLFGWLHAREGRIPERVVADELSRLDTVQGDISSLTGRIAAVRTWAYAAQRPDWIADPERWAVRARDIEEKLSDALHNKLIQRFVDRRTTMLARSMGGSVEAALVTVGPDHVVEVDGEPIGRLDGFEFHVDQEARLGERKKLVAAAERFLVTERKRRADLLSLAPDRDFSLLTEAGTVPSVTWAGIEVAKVAKGQKQLVPARPVASLPDFSRQAVLDRISTWWVGQQRSRLAPLHRIAAMAEDARTGPALRAMLAQVFAGGGVVERTAIADALVALTPEDRKAMRRLGLIIGALDVFHPMLLKPEAVRVRIAIAMAARGEAMPPLPMPGLVLLDKPSSALAQGAHLAGYRAFGDQMVRVDLVERIAHALHDQRQGAKAFVPDVRLSTSIGVGDATLQRVMRALGFRPTSEQKSGTWHWRGPSRRRPMTRAVVNPAFAALKDWSGERT